MTQIEVKTFLTEGLAPLVVIYIDGKQLVRHGKTVVYRDLEFTFTFESYSEEDLISEEEN